MYVFFFKQKTAYEMRIIDWSSDVCSSDLTLEGAGPYGSGWPSPRVAAGPFGVVSCDVVGQGHIRAILAGQDGGRLKAMAFRHGETQLGAALLAARGRKLYVAGRVKRDDWGTRTPADMPLDDAAWAGRSEDHTTELQSLMRN